MLNFFLDKSQEEGYMVYQPTGWLALRLNESNMIIMDEAREGE